MKSNARSTGPEKTIVQPCAFQGPSFKSALKRVGVTKWRLAKDLGISYRTLQYWEKGSSKPSEKLKAKVAEYLGMVIPADDEHAEIIARISAIESKLDQLLTLGGSR